MSNWLSALIVSVGRDVPVCSSRVSARPATISGGRISRRSCPSRMLTSSAATTRPPQPNTGTAAVQAFSSEFAVDVELQWREQVLGRVRAGVPDDGLEEQLAAVTGEA